MFVAALVLALFLAAAFACFTYGLPVAFAMIYIPTLLMLSNTAPVDLPALPDVTPPMGVAAGLAFGLMLKGGERMLFRWTLMDTVVILLTVCAILTGLVTNTFYTGVHVLGVETLDFVIPYFAARWAFHSPAAPPAALVATITCVCIMALFAPIEMRLWPYYYNRLMNSLAPRMRTLAKALTRFGLFRAAVSFLQPIDFGDGCLVITGMIGALASSTTVGLQNIYVQAGLAAGLMCLATSLSFGPFFACGFAISVFFCLYYIPFTRRLVILGVAVVAIGLTSMTLALLKVDAYVTHDMPAFERSYRIRAVIVQNSWPFVKQAGLFGYGEKLNQSMLHLKSVDNSYILFIMTKGWGFTLLWIAIPFLIAWRVQRAFRVTRSQLEVFALAISVSVIVGINVAMFTVWAGSIYAKVWVVFVAFTVSLTEWFLAPVTVPRRRGQASIALPRKLTPVPG